MTHNEASEVAARWLVERRETYDHVSIRQEGEAANSWVVIGRPHADHTRQDVLAR